MKNFCKLLLIKGHIINVFILTIYIWGTLNVSNSEFNHSNNNRKIFTQICSFIVTLKTPDATNKPSTMSPTRRSPMPTSTSLGTGAVNSNIHSPSTYNSESVTLNQSLPRKPPPLSRGAACKDALFVTLYEVADKICGVS